MTFRLLWVGTIPAILIHGFTVSTTLRPVKREVNSRAHSHTHSRLYETVDKREQADGSSFSTEGEGVQKRILGSQELLMLPRQYGPRTAKDNEDNKPFPQMSHVSAFILSSTPQVEVLSQAIDEAMATHPLLRCYVEGDGEPAKRIDLFEMVREGEPNPCTFVASDVSSFDSKDVLSVMDIEGEGRQALDTSWMKTFAINLDSGEDWCDVTKGPLWKVELQRLKTSTKDNPCALVFTFNHAISDQSSANLLVDHILSNVASIEESGSVIQKAVPQEIPIAMEDSVLGMNNRWSDVQAEGLSTKTVAYVSGKAAEGLRSPVILPDDPAGADKADGSGFLGSLTIISGKAPGGKSDNERKSTVQFRTLSRETTSALVERCRKNGVTVSNALSAATALTSTDFIDNGERQEGKERNYKVLQSLDMRRFGAGLDKSESVACMAGSHDLMLGPLPDRGGAALRNASPARKKELEESFWDLANVAKKQTNDFIESGGPQQATRVFDFAMTISDMNNLVNLSAQSKESQGRAYSAGIVNAGVFERQEAVQREGEAGRKNLATKHGKYKIEQVHFATSHARSGCLYQTSCLTVGDELQCTFHPAMPIVSQETNAEFADSFLELLEIIAGIKVPTNTSTLDSTSVIALPPKLLVSAAVAYGVFGLASHSNGWFNFFASVNEMKESVANPADFWGALNFWIFFAVGHPILQPILWISDVLHGTPGPKIADLVPVAFVLGNLAVIGAIAVSKEIRNAVNVFALSAFFTYIGAGLDGKAGLGDFNLALDDGVKGCPAYEEVRQPSMNEFDLSKYQGLWYEQKFHDWTQFKEVYDTTLDIKLTEDGKGWIDDFAVKGPAPKSAKLSWDKSPVANGAHYFLFGRVDENDPKGILRESGFGVEFPNYIVDVQKDKDTGAYKEAIQFQCLERGGVRVFEGINFMSRNPSMSEEELTAMHSRAEKAGMYRYGASPEQMHSVARRPTDAPPIDNSWQAMWRAIGVDKLLELLTESIEDGGR